MEIFDYVEGTRPLLVSIPHDGRELARGMAERMTETGRANVDADWHVRRLYDFAAELGASVITTQMSRYMVDLNRDPSGAALYPNAINTGTVPHLAFDGRELYKPGAAPSAAETAERIERYWRPYHARIAAALDDIAARFGGVVLFDAHSISSEVPRLFEGRLPDFNLGTAAGRSAAEDLEAGVYRVLDRAKGYTAVLNGRFKGGYITRHYGAPGRHRHALQLELSQATYMNEGQPFDFLAERAGRVTPVLRAALSAARDWATEHYCGD